jgi:hypothetical protein
MTIKAASLATLIAAHTVSIAAQAAELPTLSAIYAADQADRQPNVPRNERKIDWPAVKLRDAERQKQTRELLRTGGLKSAEDYYHAAVVFQHSDTDSDIDLAHALAVISATLDPTPEEPRYMSAATWDRYLTRKGKPQWYGTQFKRDDTGKWVLLPVEPGAVYDNERRRLAVSTLAESQAEMDKLNAAR